MSVVNEIYPFAAEASVDLGEVLTLTAYHADMQRLRGNQPGIARSALVNTVLRQTSHIAAGLAQFIANRYAAGVKDDGDLDAIEAGLLSAITSIVSSVTDPFEAELAALDALRKRLIGIPLPWRSTTLPPNHVWADGSLVLFEDWPELEEIYNAGGLSGLLLAWDADEETIAANIGKWRPNSANPTGLFVPSLGGQFSRAWVPGSGTAGGTNAAGLPALEGAAHYLYPTAPNYGATSSGALKWLGLADYYVQVVSAEHNYGSLSFDASRCSKVYGGSTTVMPPSLDIPHTIYLGLTS